MLDSVFVSASGVGLVFAMPGDPAALDNITKGLVLTAADLLHSVVAKLPPFWPDNIETWLIQSESQFRLKGVTVSQTKFDHVVQSMSQTDAVKVLDLICAPPRDDPYGHLKNHLLRMYGLTDFPRFEAISSLQFFGGHASFSSYVQDAISSTSWSGGMFLSPWSFPQMPPRRCLISPCPRQHLGPSHLSSPCQ